MALKADFVKSAEWAILYLPNRLQLFATLYLIFLTVQTFTPDSPLDLYCVTFVTSLMFAYTKKVVVWRQLRIQIYSDLACINLLYIFYCRCYKSHSSLFSLALYLAVVARYAVSQFLNTPWLGYQISVFEKIVPLVLEQLADLQLRTLQRLNRNLNQ